MENLYHVSECGSVERFEPKPAPSAWSDMGVTEPSVWAIDEEHLINYLLPRDCPRVTYYALEESKKEDIERLLGPSFSRHIVAIEEGWLERAMKADIWIYEFQNDPFIVVDQGAGYFISRGSVIPVEKRKVENPLTELISRGAEL
ncbi:MAG: hypothetical protein JKY51_03255, partial [Opitutaceae bacterium]|nr:hypothetical protein [Opitutaceae bacterium]